MVIQYYTLLKIIDEFQSKIGMELIEIFTQEKNTLILSMADEESEFHLEISTDNKYSSIFFRDNFARARKNTTDLFPDLIGDILQDAEIINQDRIIKLSFIRTDLFIFLFGRGSSNIFEVSKSGKIIDAFENSEEYIGKNFTLPGKTEHKENLNLWEYVSGKPYLFGKHYANLFFDNYKLDKNIKLRELSENNRLNLEENLKLFKENILGSNEYYLHKINNNYIFSLIDLKEEIIDRSSNISELIRKKISFSKKEDDFNEYYKIAIKKIERNLKKAEGKLKSAEHYEKSLERAQKYKNYGDLLMSQPNPKSIPGESITLNDFEGNKLTINLDDKLNLIENAQKYYEKSKKSEKEANIKFESIDKAKVELEESQKIFDEFHSIKETKKLKKFLTENSKELGINMGENTEKESKFRHFDLDGWDFYVGKNAANNDELTMRFAKPNDIWFHARGVSGSHCIIRKDKKDKLPKEILKKAAALSAYYSAARKGKYVPVAYTEKKYVRKPKGANVGAVIMQKEDVILVDPLDPSDL